MSINTGYPPILDEREALNVELMRIYGLEMELEELEAQEPECTCIRLDVDYYDTGGCELCDSQSEWNLNIRHLTRLTATTPGNEAAEFETTTIAPVRKPAATATTNQIQEQTA